MKKILYKKPFFLFLLPVFFVWHGYTENIGLITAGDCFFLLAGYLAAAVLLYGLFYFIYRNGIKAAIVSAMLLSVYFFFGSLHDFLKEHTTTWHRYSVLLPILFVIVLVVAFYLKRTSTALTGANFFLNILFLVYILFDGAELGWKAFHPDINQYKIHDIGVSTVYQPCDSCPKPDIYFFVFDEYSSSRSLLEDFQYDNSDLDSFLVRKNFRLQPNSFSNYNFTPFSMASILNMGYIRGIRDAGNITADNYENAEKLIGNNAVIDFLRTMNYEIVNLSVFDLVTGPSPVEESLLPLKTRLITKQTLFSRAMHDIGWNLGKLKPYLPWLNDNAIYTNLNNNNKLLEMVVEESKRSLNQPRFIYTHLEMPHWPFYFDKNSQLRKKSDLLTGINIVDKKSYTEYLTYTNGKIKDLVNIVQKNTDGKACIILMSDHGYRVNPGDNSDSHDFKNLNAIYFPSKDYHHVKDSSSAVNQFRVVFNTLFNQSFPILKDSAIFLKDQVK